MRINVTLISRRTTVTVPDYFKVNVEASDVSWEMLLNSSLEMWRSKRFSCSSHEFCDDLMWRWSMILRFPENFPDYFVAGDSHRQTSLV